MENAPDKLEASVAEATPQRMHVPELQEGVVRCRSTWDVWRIAVPPADEHHVMTLFRLESAQDILREAAGFQSPLHCLSALAEKHPMRD